MATKENQLIRLHRLAGGHDENFLTECLAHMLAYCIEKEPECAVELLNFLGRPNLSQEDIVSTVVQTQLATPFGVPDLVLRGTDFLVFVEVKVDSGLGDDQLSRYRKALEQSEFSDHSLVTLTRYPLEYNNDKPDIAIRWHELAERFETMCPKTDVGCYLLQEFLEFLRWRGLTMDQVSWELDRGLRSFQSLLDMLMEALRANEIGGIQRSAAWDWHGYYLEYKKFFVGIYFSEPKAICFNTEVEVEEPIPEEIRLGEIQNRKWHRKLDLSSEEIHFFARSKASQLQCLESFLEETVAYARQLVGQ